MSGKKQKNNTAESAGPKPVEPKAIVDYKHASRNAPKPVAASKPAAAAPTAAAPAPAKAATPAAAAAQIAPVAAAPNPNATKGPKGTIQTDFTRIQNAGAPKPSGRGSVRAVLSGDCIVVGEGSGERAVTLSGIQAPRFARSRNSNDEAWGWHAREFLRKRVIGRDVTYTINFSQPANSTSPGRDYGTVMVGNENLAQIVVKAGWATVKSGAVGKDGKPHPEREELQRLEAEASKAGLGVHNKAVAAEDAQRLIDWNPDARALFAKHRGQPVAAIIDQVKDGSTLRCELIPDQNTLSHVMINLHLAGVQCPRLPPPMSVIKQQNDRKAKPAAAADDDDDSESAAAPAPAPQQQQQKVPPFAVEAQKCTEEKLLHREVFVLLQGVDKFNNFFGTVQFPAGNIALFLLENGFATLVDWSAKLTADAPKYLVAQTNAQKNRLRLYANYNAEAAAKSAAAAAKDDKSEYRVVQVNSGDTILVADSKEVEYKLSLASIRAPRVGNVKRGEEDEPYAFEAREFLRKKLIGKKVKRTIDYNRPPPPDQKDRTPRPFATVYFEGQNVGEQLVSLGLATVIKHRAEDPRASGYEALCLAEAQATETKKGIHNHMKQAPVHHIVDLSERFGGKGESDDKNDNKKRSLSAKARSHLPALKKERHGGVVEYVFTGSRLKVFVPKENCIISLALAGIRAPGPKTDDGKADPLGELALAYTRRNVLQQNVLIDVEDIDKGDNFIGTLWFNNANLSVHLLREGLAKVFSFSADKLDNAAELYAAETEAKNAKKGVWKNYVEPSAADLKAAATPEREFSGGKEFVNVKVTEILDGAHFFVHIAEDKGVAAIETALAQVSDDSAVPTSFARGSLLAGQFNDGSWYRVRIEAGTSRADGGDGWFSVFFVDYGNSDDLEEDNLRVLPGQLAKLPALAHECVLAGVKAPSVKNEYFDDAAHALNDLIFDKPILAKVELQEAAGAGGKLHVSLYEPNNPLSINAQLLKECWLRIVSAPHPKLKALVDDTLREYEDEAKKQRPRRGIWSRGDVSDEDETPAEDWRGALPAKKTKAAPKASTASAAAPASKPDQKTAAKKK